MELSSGARRIGWWMLWANLAAALVLSLTVPEPMVSPGPLVAGHSKLAKDCFACHSPFRGPSDEKCSSCHEPSKIGSFDSSGKKLDKTGGLAGFHSRLRSTSCSGCHRDHEGTRLVSHPLKFDHDLLAATDGKACSTCHASPRDRVHAEAGSSCSSCHGTRGWKPARFDHAKLSDKETCRSCHRGPRDKLHSSSAASCSTCHSTTKWKPATFDHFKKFDITGDHKAECQTCHRDGADYSSYTCYGCHEHTERKILRKHSKEGIRDFSDCVACHRNGDEHDIRSGRDDPGTGGRRGGDDD